MIVDSLQRVRPGVQVQPVERAIATTPPTSASGGVNAAPAAASSGTATKAP